MSAILFEYSVKALKSLEGFKPVLLLIKKFYFASHGSLAYSKTLSASDCWSISLNKEFTDP